MYLKGHYSDSCLVIKYWFPRLKKNCDSLIRNALHRLLYLNKCWSLVGRDVCGGLVDVALLVEVLLAPGF